MQFTRSIGSGPGFGVIHGAELDAVHSSDRFRAWLEFHRAIDTQPTVLQSRYIMQQNATGFAIAVHHATKRHRFCNRGTSSDTHRAGLQLRSAAGRYSMQFTRWIRCRPWFRCDHRFRAWLEFHRAIDTQPTVLQSRYIMQQNATGFAIAVHHATKRHRFCNRGTSSDTHRAGLQLRSAAGRARCRSLDGSDPGRGFGVNHGAELDAGHSMDRIRAGIHRATHTGPGCSCDPLRTVVSV